MPPPSQEIDKKTMTPEMHLRWEGGDITQQIHEGSLPSSVWPNDDNARPHVNADVKVLEAKVITARVLEVNVGQLHPARTSSARVIQPSFCRPPVAS